MRISSYQLTRFQFARDRVIGDSQVRADEANIASLELIDEKGKSGLGFVQVLFNTLPNLDEIVRIFDAEVWPGLKGRNALEIAHQVSRPRGGNQRAFTLPFHEAVQVAVWDLAAKQQDLPLHKLLGARRDKVRAYASGLDYHLSDEAFLAFFAQAAALGYPAFKIKVGNPDFDWDLHRLTLLSSVIPAGARS